MLSYINGFKEYLTNVKMTSKNTLESYTRDILQFLDYCKSNSVKDISEINHDFINTYIEYIKKTGKSDSTKTRVIASLKCFFKYLKNEKIITVNPAETIKNPRNAKKLPGTLDAKEIMLLLAQPDGNDYKSLRDRAILELLYATGMKVSELIELNLNDVNTQIGIVNLHSGKTSRIVPVYQQASKHIFEYINYARPAIISEPDEERLFVNMNGKPISRQGCWKIIKFYADKAGIKDEITPQTLRHSFATHLLENGAQLKDVKEMLGHSDISSTQIYATIIKNKFLTSYEKFHPLAGKK